MQKLAVVLFIILGSVSLSNPAQQGLTLRSRHLSAPLTLGGFYYESAAGRTSLPVQLTPQNKISEWRSKTSEGRAVSLLVIPAGDNYTIRLSAQPADGIKKWGFQIESGKDEYFTGLMERVVDGPQQASWAPEGDRKDKLPSPSAAPTCIRSPQLQIKSNM